MAVLVGRARIDCSTPDILLCSTSQGAEATFPLDDPARQLNRWRLVWDHARLVGKFVAAIDLSIAKNVTARLVDATTVNPVPPTRPPTPRTPRRHV